MLLIAGCVTPSARRAANGAMLGDHEKRIELLELHE